MPRKPTFWLKITWLLRPQKCSKTQVERISNDDVCTEETCYLGAAIGKARFLQSFVRDKVDAWVCEIKTLSTIALDQPQAAYAAFTHGVRSRWNYLMRTMPEIDMELQALEDAIRLEFIPALTGQDHLSDELRNLLPLPVRTGGLGLYGRLSYSSTPQSKSLHL